MKLSNKETALQAIELLDLKHEPAVELYTENSMAYMLNHPPFNINAYKNIHAPKFFSAFPDLIHNIENIFEDGDTVVLEIVCTGTHKGTFLGIEATNKNISYRSVVFYKFIGGKISQTRAVYDQMGLLEQIGVFFK
jgi:steroid delta-isomerase-like uncharacterized protein